MSTYPVVCSTSLLCSCLPSALYKLTVVCCAPSRDRYSRYIPVLDGLPYTSAELVTSTTEPGPVPAPALFCSVAAIILIRSLAISSSLLAADTTSCPQIALVPNE